MKICPRCGSDNIDWIIPQNWSQWVCKTCSYTGPVIDGDEKLIREIREDYIKQLQEKNKETDETTSEEEPLEEELTDEEMEKKLDELMDNN